MTPNHEERMKQLMLKRVTFTAELADVRALLANYEEGGSVTFMQNRLNDLESEYARYSKNQREVDDTDNGLARSERIAIKNKFLQCKADITDLIERVTRPNKQPTDRNMMNTPSTSYADLVANGAALPTIQIPTFSGAYEDWPRFADQFRCTVHDNSQIDDCKKLLYLRSCLTQEAADAITSLSNTARNYPIAWEILERLYNQPAKIVYNHLKALF